MISNNYKFNKTVKDSYLFFVFIIIYGFLFSKYFITKFLSYFYPFIKQTYFPSFFFLFVNVNCEEPYKQLLTLMQKFIKFSFVVYKGLTGYPVQYPAGSSHFSVSPYPAEYRISKSGYRITGILLIFEKLRCFNALCNSIEYSPRSYFVIHSTEISSIRHPPDIRPDIWNPVFIMAGYPVRLLSGPSLLFI